MPPLRDDVRLYEGIRTEAGAPTYVLQDPATGGHVQLGARELEMLTRWQLADPTAIAGAVGRQSAFAVEPAEVEALRAFLEQNGLLRLDGRATHALWRRQQARRANTVQRVLGEHLLFRRVPLLAPARFLTHLAPRVAFFFAPAFWLALALLAMFALALVWRDFEQFRAGISAMLGLEGAVAIAVALIAAKLAHELAHACTAHRHGAEVPVMGLMLIVLWPILYTETSAAWTVRDRWKRIQIAIAGVAVELVLAIMALALWPLLEPGALRDAAAFVGTTLVVLSLAVNANPLMRFDGYFVLAEVTGMDNLQPRAFALLGWWLRRWIAGATTPLPEPDLSRRALRWLLVYGIASMLYRVVLFAGIAYALYALLPAALGLPLAGLVLTLFLIVPTVKEVRDILRAAVEGAGGRGLLVPALLLAHVAMAFFVPWQSAVVAPAVLESGRATDLFTPEPARLEHLGVDDGALVDGGAVLMTLASPDLEHQLAKARREVEELQRIIARHLTARERHAELGVRIEDLARAESALAGLEARAVQLRILAPHAGRFAFAERGFAAGAWVRPETALATLVAREHRRAVAYVGERDIANIALDARVDVRLDGWPDIAMVGRVERVLEEAVPALDEPVLGAPGGGPIVVDANALDGRPVPLGAIYKVVVALEPTAELEKLPAMKLRAFARIATPQRNLAGRLVERILGLWRREIG